MKRFHSQMFNFLNSFLYTLLHQACLTSGESFENDQGRENSDGDIRTVEVNFKLLLLAFWS